MAHTVPFITFNNGHKVPILGLGTSQFSFVEGQGPEPTTDGTRAAVENAIDIGYRHIDTALMYRNEVEVGQGIKNKLDIGVVKREELFITTKLWSTYNHPSRVLDGLKRSLKNLQLDYVDLFLIHSPASYVFVDEGTWSPLDEHGKMRYEKVDHADTWKEMEKAVDMGLTKSIGLSNFNRKQIQHILDNCRIKPANLQSEGHAYLMQHKIFAFCQQNNITFTAFAPLGSPARWTKRFQKDDPVLLEEPVVQKIAQNHNKTPSQILLRFIVERGRLAIPRSTQKAHLQENFDIFDFQFALGELEELDKLDKEGIIRYFPFDHIRDSPDFPGLEWE